MEIGNFIVTEKDNRTCISYKRPVREWLDIILILALGVGVAVFIVLMYFQTYFHQWIFWLLAGLFGILAWVKTAEGISRLREPTQDIIVMDQKEKQLITKLGNRKGTRYDFKEIKEVILKGGPEEKTINHRSKMHSGWYIEILTRNGEEKIITIIPERQEFFGRKKAFASDTGRISRELARMIQEKTEASL